ncbi:MAG: PilZ domain-containing protein [Deltaproteobacteria bacterium]|nr:PilZ domain-containing protein [Deltaproteobacteria bacterium]
MKLEFNDRRAQKAADAGMVPETGVAAGRSDRRRYPRLEAPVECIYVSDRQTIVRSFANINIRGLFVETSCPDPVGTRMLLRIGIPGREEMVCAAGEVIWRKDEKTSSVLKGRGMGIRFTLLEEPARKAIAAYLISRGGLSAFPQLKTKFALWM